MRWLCCCLLLVTACAGSGSDDSDVASDPLVSATQVTAASNTTVAALTTTVVAPTTDPAAVVPTGFELVAATARKADGTICELCLRLAESEDQRGRGLMFVTDLGGADGMVFVYPEPHSGAFWMKNTVTPLSIAFFDAAGTFLDAFDMEPCTADPCPQYPTPDSFTFAIEATQGGLSDLGLEPGSVFQLLGTPCPLT